MASQITYVALICLLAAQLVASQTTSSSSLSSQDELNKKDQSINDQQPQQNLVPDQPKEGPSNELAPSAPTNQQQQYQYQSQGETSSEDQEQNNNQFMRPHEPFMRPFFSLFNGGNLFDSMRQHSQNMDRQFEQLRQQAAEGQEVRYFSRNGVSYVRTCTTKRV